MVSVLALQENLARKGQSRAVSLQTAAGAIISGGPCTPNKHTEFALYTSKHLHSYRQTQTPYTLAPQWKGEPAYEAW